MFTKSWIRNLFSFHLSKSSKKNKPSRQLSLLSLEDRIVPAVPFSPAFPHAISIVTNTGSSGAPASTTADFTVTFNSPVTGVDAADFNTIATGTVAVGSLAVSGSGTTYTVTANTITGNGTLGLNLVDTPSISAAAAFASQESFGVGNSPYSGTLGDVNCDGKLDILTANTFFSGNSASVLLGNGDGTFQSQATFAVGTSPFSGALGDVNGDGNLDIVTANGGSDTTSVLLGNGDGTFQSQATFAVGDNPYSVTLGDVNGDGNLDIVTANCGSTTTSVLLGNGDGTFQSQATFAVGTFPFSGALGDVNGDGNLDIVTANNVATASVLLGNGNGTFQSQATFAVGAAPRSIVLGDVNGDGRLDIVTANSDGDNASVLLGNGNGTFQSQATFAVGGVPHSVTLGDVNGDYRLDIVTANLIGNTASVLLGNGDGTFAGQTTFAIGAGSRTVTLGDVNSDGRLDIVTANSDGDNVSVLLGTGGSALTVAFSTVATPATGNTPYSVANGDVNGDGKLDLVTANRYSNNTSVLLGNGNGTFQAQNTFAVGTNPGSVTLGDVNGDGRLDIVTADQYSTTASVLLGNGDGTFGGQTAFVTGPGPTSLTLGDVNGDGYLDIVTANGGNDTASVLLGNGNGTFNSPSTFYSVGGGPRSIVLGDVNGDGKLDIVTANRNSNTASVLLGNGNGSFASQTSFVVGNAPESVTLGDVNGDGKLDIVTADNYDGTTSVLLGNGNGTFQAQATFAVGERPKSVVLGDVNGDGKLDIVATDNYYSTTSVLLGNGNGTFKAQATFAVGTYPSSVVLGEVNGDGRLDITTGTSNYYGNNVSVLLNSLAFTGQTYNISSGTAPAITSANNTSFTYNTTGTFIVTATGDPAPTFSISAGALPAGVTLSSAGALSGAATATGTFNFTITASNGIVPDATQPFTLTVNQAASTTTLVAAPNPSVFGQSVTFTATVASIAGTPEGTVDFFAGAINLGTRTLSGGGASIDINSLGVGGSTITAVYNGNPNFSASTSSITTQTVNQASSITVLTAAPSPSVFGQTVTFTATVSAVAPGAGTPSGTVNFFDGATLLGTGTLTGGVATLTTSSLAVGSGHSIAASYSGDTNFATSIGSTLQTVNQAASTTTLLGAPNPSVFGQTVTFTATVSAVVPGAGIPSGSVNFFDGATLLGTGTLTGGVATLSTSLLAVGSGHSIAASYSGDAGFTSSTSPMVTQTVNLAPTITSANSADFTLAVAGSFTVTTTASFPVAVSFTITSGTLPAGLTLNSSTGVLSGTPATGTFGTYNLTITASNGVNPDAVQPFTLKVLLAPAPLVTGSAPPAGNDPTNPGNSVNLYDPVTGQPNGVAVPFPNFMGEIRVSAGDFNQDGRSEIVAAAGPNGGPAIAILDSVTGEVRAAFFAYGQGFTGGVFVAVKDVNNDGFADIITGAGAGGGPHVKVFNGVNLQEIASFFAYAETFSGGVSVASADINGDNVLDIVTGAGPGGGPHVKVFDGASQSLISQWYAYPVDFTGGVFVGMGDLGNDGNFEVITGAGSGGGPVVAVFDPFTGELQTQFLAYAPQFLGGVRVGASDGTGDGVTDLITGAGPGGGPHVKAFSYPDLDLLFEYFSGPISDSTGVFVS